MRDFSSITNLWKKMKTKHRMGTICELAVREKDKEIWNIGKMALD